MKIDIFQRMKPRRVGLSEIRDRDDRGHCTAIGIRVLVASITHHSSSKTIDNVIMAHPLLKTLFTAAMS
jgi:hypothetical protein